jgi:hypothetical protein
MSIKFYLILIKLKFIVRKCCGISTSFFCCKASEIFFSIKISQFENIYLNIQALTQCDFICRKKNELLLIKELK